MSILESVPDDIPHDRPSAARMYDYFLGGYHNFDVDRRAAEQAIAIWPDMPQVMQANRAFLRRAVRFLVAQGIEQFLDIGSGIPTVGNVHEVAQVLNPSARVVYVDNEPIAVAHSAAILRGNPNSTIIQADARQPLEILRHPESLRLLDLDKPVAVLLVSLLHFITDDEEAYSLVGALRNALAPGSYLVISQGSDENLRPETLEQMERLYARTATPLRGRSRAQIERFFDGFELVEPGVVYIPLWRPEGPDDLFLDQPDRCPGFAGVGRKP